jgi:ubiquinone/menaquinone biosynthesis C-methylase UbiE
MNVRQMQFADGFFDFVIDKGTLDCVALSTDKRVATAEMLNEVSRILAPHGQYFVFSMHPLAGERLELVSQSHLNWTAQCIPLAHSPLELPEQEHVYLYVIEKN